MSAISTLPLALQVVSQIMGAKQGLSPLVGGGQPQGQGPMPLTPRDMPQGPGNFTHPESPIMQQAIQNQRPDMPPDGFAGGGGIAGLGNYQTGGGKVVGPGDGMSDSVDAVIDGQEPAKIASGEHILSSDIVSDLGNGDSEAGHRRLYKLTDSIRKARHGTTKQPPQIKRGLASLMGLH